VVSLGVSSGANSINGLTFGLADPATLEQEARAAAVENARQRGQQLAELTGKTLGEAVIVTEVLGAFPLTNFDLTQSQSRGGAAPIEQGQLSVTVNVQITFSVS
jgi:hypothetical protein